MYSITDYGHMLADSARTDAYARALRQAVKPGSVVLDIGTGTGFLALLACRFGARRVYAVESGDVIEVARQIASANRCADTIEFMQAVSTEISLPEPADVIVSDLRGVLPFYGRHLPSIVDARRRLLAPGGLIIPSRDTLWLACVEAPTLHRPITTPWSNNKYDFDMRAAGDLLSHRWRPARFKAEQMMSSPQNCGSIDYSTVVSPNLDASARMTATRAATAHGLCVWFEATLAEGIHYSNSPEHPRLVYDSAFFPWPEPLSLEAGDALAVRLKANLIGNDYVWTWDTRVAPASRPEAASVHFRQSTFFAEPLSPARLRQQSASHVARLTGDGLIDLEILGMMNQDRTLEEIARHLASRFPERFASWQDALTRVGEMSTRYGR